MRLNLIVRSVAVATLVAASFLAVARESAPASSSFGAGRVPGAVALRACAGAGPFWPTMTLALTPGSAWVGCKEQARVIRVDTRTRKTVASLRLSAPVIAVVAGFSSIWALDTSATLYRIRPRGLTVTKRIDIGSRAPYKLWIGGGSVWVLDDDAARSSASPLRRTASAQGSPWGTARQTWCSREPLRG
jgi:hypothetical protein